MSDMSNGRITTREFYDALLETNKEIAKINVSLADIGKQPEICQAYFASLAEKTEKNAKEISKVRNLNAGIALLASTIAGIIGINK